MREIETPVLIVGGGGAGLTASMLLSTMGVEALLVSSLPTTSTRAAPISRTVRSAAAKTTYFGLEIGAR